MKTYQNLLRLIGMDTNSSQASDSVKPVTGGELNSWRRGFTPQAEIWNGRMAMFALAFGFGTLILANFILGH